MKTAELLARIERFCERNKIAQSRFGRDAVGASNFVTRLRNGKTVTVETADRALTFMREWKR